MAVHESCSNRLGIFDIYKFTVEEGSWSSDIVANSGGDKVRT